MRVRVCVLGGWLWWTSAWGAPAGEDPAAGEDRAAEQVPAEQQDWLRLVSRRAVAQAKIEARRQFVVGRASLHEAYPTLAGGALGSAALLKGRLELLQEAEIARARQLQEAEIARARQRVAEPERDPARWRDELAGALAAEGEADQLERALIVSILGGLEAQPRLQVGRTGWLIEPLESAALAIQALPEDAEPERRQAIGAAAALADEAQVRLGSLLQALRLVAAGLPLPDPAQDLALLDDPLRAAAAADRLALLLPFLPPSQAEPVQEALEGYLQEITDARRAELAVVQASLQAVALPTDAPEVLRSEVTAALARRDRASARVAGIGDVDGAYLQLARIELALYEQQLALARERLALKEGEAAAVLDAAQTEAEQAEAEAEAARAAVENVRDQLLADALTDHAAARARISTVQAGVAEAEAQLELHRDTVSRISGLKRKVAGVQELSALSGERPDPNAVYRDLRHVLGELRASPALRGERVGIAEQALRVSEEAVARDRGRLAEARGLLQGLEGEAQEKLRATLAGWEEGLEQEGLASRRWVDLAQQERDTLFAALQQARIAKRELYPYIGSELRQQDSSMLLPDIAKEVQLLVPSVASRVRSRALDLLSAPTLLTDWNVLWRLITGSLWSLMSGVAWWWGRNRAKAWALWIANRVRRFRPELRSADVGALREPLARAIRNTIDLLLGSLLLWSLGEGLPELQFLVRVYLYLSTYRALLAAFDLAVVPNTQVRPAWLVMAPRSYELSRRTFRLFLSYAIVSRLLHFLLWDVLGLDTLAGLVRLLMSLLFWLLVALSLYRWEPITRERLQRRAASTNPLFDRLTAEGHPLLRVPRAVGQLVFFGAVLASELSNRLAQEGTSLTWLFNLVSRYRLKEDDPAAVQLLPGEVVRRLVQGDTPRKHLIERGEIEEIAVALERWRATRLRGLVAVVGDRGSGKSTACQLLAEQLAGGALPIRQGQMPEGLQAPEALLRWLSETLGCGTDDSAEALVEQLEAAEPQIVLLEDVGRCFARRVGGLELIRTLLYVLNATSARHFYVVSLHGPTWDHLASSGSMVDCGVFRTVVRLAPLTSTQLRALTLARAGIARVKLDFSGLQRSSALGGDPEVELERSIGVFYRLLAEASAGSPTVALELFARCLEPTDDPHRVRVRMGGALSMQVVAELSDDALFVLVALNLHERLQPEGLVDVTNLSVPAIRAILRDLESRDLVCRADGSVSIPDRHRVAVQRTLRRRHFLHLGIEP